MIKPLKEQWYGQLYNMSQTSEENDLGTNVNLRIKTKAL